MNIVPLIVAAAVGGGLGFFAAALYFAWTQQKRRQKKGKRRKLEFIKLVLTSVMATYFLGVVIGVKIVLADTMQLGTLLAYIGTPTATVIIFYAWKAKAENVIKIKKNNPEITDSVSEIGNI